MNDDTIVTTSSQPKPTPSESPAAATTTEGFPATSGTRIRFERNLRDVLHQNSVKRSGVQRRRVRSNPRIREQIPNVFQDLVERARYAQLLRESLVVWKDACNNAPSEWWFVDGERTVPTDFDPAAALNLLNRCTTEEFWRLAP